MTLPAHIVTMRASMGETKLKPGNRLSWMGVISSHHSSLDHVMVLCSIISTVSMTSPG